MTAPDISGTFHTPSAPELTIEQVGGNFCIRSAQDIEKFLFDVAPRTELTIIVDSGKGEGVAPEEYRGCIEQLYQLSGVLRFSTELEPLGEKKTLLIGIEQIRALVFEPPRASLDWRLAEMLRRGRPRDNN